MDSHAWSSAWNASQSAQRAHRKSTRLRLEMIASGRPRARAANPRSSEPLPREIDSYEPTRGDALHDRADGWCAEAVDFVVIEGVVRQETGHEQPDGFIIE